MNSENPHIGSSLDDLLQADDMLDEISATAIKRTIAMQIESEMSRQGISKSEMSRRMRTSKTQVDRLLDPEQNGVQLDTLFKAATAVGKTLSVQLI